MQANFGCYGNAGGVSLTRWTLIVRGKTRREFLHNVTVSSVMWILQSSLRISWDDMSCCIVCSVLHVLVSTVHWQWSDVQLVGKLYLCTSHNYNYNNNRVPALAFNPLTAMKKIVPTPGVFWSKSNFFLNYIRQRQNIYVARYQYSLGIYRRQLAYAIFLLRGYIRHLAS